jgi:germination protein M
MKKCISLLLCLCLLLSFCGCARRVEAHQVPVRFYYPRTIDAIQYTASGGAFTYEDREGAGYTDNIPYLLNLYFRGPADATLRNPFPTATSVTELKVYGKYAFLTVSDSFAQLTGMELTIACACLTLTVTELTGAETLCLRTNSQLLDNHERLLLQARDFLFMDDTTAPRE